MFSGLKAPKDVLAGIIFLAFGLTTFLLARRYELGTAVQMGPGYFPAAVGLVLTVVGAIALVRGLMAANPDPIAPHKLEPLVLLFVGILLFALLIERAGLVIAAAALIGTACYRRLRTNPFEVLLTYAVLTAFSAVVFVVWLGLQLPLFWWR